MFNKAPFNYQRQPCKPAIQKDINYNLTTHVLQIEVDVIGNMNITVNPASIYLLNNRTI